MKLDLTKRWYSELDNTVTFSEMNRKVHCQEPIFLSLASRDVLTMPGPRSIQVPLSAGRCHLKSHFSCAVALHLAGSTMRYL